MLPFPDQNESLIYCTEPHNKVLFNCNLVNLIIVPHFNHDFKKNYETRKNKKKLFSPIFYYRSIKNVYIHPKPKKKDNYFVAFYDCIMKKKTQIIQKWENMPCI